jgi:hypothetical protein
MSWTSDCLVHLWPASRTLRPSRAPTTSLNQTDMEIIRAKPSRPCGLRPAGGGRQRTRADFGGLLLDVRRLRGCVVVAPSNTHFRRCRCGVGGASADDAGLRGPATLSEAAASSRQCPVCVSVPHLIDDACACARGLRVHRRARHALELIADPTTRSASRRAIGSPTSVTPVSRPSTAYPGGSLLAG